MSIAAAPASLYVEKTGNVTSQETVDRYLEELNQAKSRVPTLSIRDRIAIASACLDGMMAHVDEWVAAACKAKGLKLGSSLGSEELANGPLATARYLRLIMRSLADIEAYGVPQLPGEITQGPDGKLRVQVVPTRGLFDAIAFTGFKAHVVMEEGVTKENLSSTMASYYRDGCRDTGIALVLGAGNVSSIAPTDAFSKFFQEGKVCLLKMNPVNEYLGPIFEKAFVSLIDAGYLRVIYGGADIGAYAIGHDLVDEVHITGSVYSHDTIVWGPPGPERDRRKAEEAPLLAKKITSELGNVSPWIMVPGPYKDKELAYQAENLVASVVNNGSFNCVATKCVITWKNWPQRQQFLDKVEEVLRTVPPRKAYYPGAIDRFKKFAKKEPAGVEQGALPWTLIRSVDPNKDPLYFQEESCGGVFVETAIDAPSEAES
ncbi:MAG: aldehyde dehydrogenase [Planctomycetota bacterium]